jgi:parallel beta-helix repeat protein
VSAGTWSEGVGIWADSTTGLLITGNQVYGNNGPGVLLEKTTNSVATYNVVFNNTPYSITSACDTCGGSTANIEIRVGEGMNSSGNLVANNTSYGGWWGIANLDDYNSGATATTNNNIFRNNIAVNAVSHNLYSANGGDNNGTQGSGNVYDHNAFGVANPGFVYWNGNVNTYAALDTVYGSAMNNVQSNPIFTSTSTNNFTIASSSPAIGAGVNLGSTYEYALDPASTWPSNIVLDNQNSYGSGWDIGAYVYTQTSTPSVAMTAPTANSTVSGTISVSATLSAVSPASIAAVQFYLDGSPLGSAVTSSPYTISWNTGTATNASHTLYALATDNYSNTATSTSITVTVANQAVLSVPTSTLNFSAAHGSTATSTQSVVVKNAGATSTTLNWSATSTQPWLTFLPSSGSLAGGASSSMSIIANQSGLSVGTYNATATIADSNASGSPQTFAVTLTINTPPPPPGVPQSAFIVIVPSSVATTTAGQTSSATATSTATSTTATTTASSSAASSSSLQAILNALTAKLQSLEAEAGSALTQSSSSYVFPSNLTLFDTGTDVQMLQKYLNGHGFPVSLSGPGSPGNETTRFGL